MHKSGMLRNYKAEAKATSIELELQLTQIITISCKLEGLVTVSC